jgi:hypothetical protein
MLRRPKGATVDELASAIGWQRHTRQPVFCTLARGAGFLARRTIALDKFSRAISTN